MSPIEIVRAQEEKIKFNRFESAFAVDSAGHILLEKSGEQYWLGIMREEVERLEAAAGVIFTHNHPRGWEYPSADPRHVGNSFSDADIELACATRMREIRVVTPTDRFFMRPGSTGWDQDYWDHVLFPLYTAQELNVKRDFRRAMEQREMTLPEASARLYHEIWLRVANETGLVYGKEQE